MRKSVAQVFFFVFIGGLGIVAAAIAIGVHKTATEEISAAVADLWMNRIMIAAAVAIVVNWNECNLLAAELGQEKEKETAASCQ